MQIKIKRLNPQVPLPFYATQGSAAMDLTAVCPNEGIVIEPMQRVLIPTGIAVALPSADYVGLLFARSSLGVKKGVALANGVGVIDADYRGEICVALVNLSNETVVIQNGERIAQLAVMPIARVQIEEVDTLDETLRGAGGFGSTGQ